MSRKDAKTQTQYTTTSLPVWRGHPNPELVPSLSKYCVLCRVGDTVAMLLGKPHHPISRDWMDELEFGAALRFSHDFRRNILDFRYASHNASQICQLTPVISGMRGVMVFWKNHGNLEYSISSLFPILCRLNKQLASMPRLRSGQATLGSGRRQKVPQ